MSCVLIASNVAHPSPPKKPKKTKTTTKTKVEIIIKNHLFTWWVLISYCEFIKWLAPSWFDSSAGITLQRLWVKPLQGWFLSGFPSATTWIVVYTVYNCGTILLKILWKIWTSDLILLFFVFFKASLLMVNLTHYVLLEMYDQYPSSS